MLDCLDVPLRTVLWFLSNFPGGKVVLISIGGQAAHPKGEPHYYNADMRPTRKNNTLKRMRACLSP